MQNMLHCYIDSVTLEVRLLPLTDAHLVLDRQVVAVGEPSLAPPDALGTPAADWAGKQAVGSP